MERKKVSRLKVAFDEMSTTNKQQAKFLNKNPAVISKQVTNAAQPCIETFILLAEILKMKVDDLLRGEWHAL